MSSKFMPFSAGDIARAVEEGREAERERIIKLLNSAKGTGNNCNCDDCEQTNYYIDSLVDLIKGENND